MVCMWYLYGCIFLGLRALLMLWGLFRWLVVAMGIGRKSGAERELFLGDSVVRME